MPLLCIITMLRQATSQNHALWIVHTPSMNVWCVQNTASCFPRAFGNIFIYNGWLVNKMDFSLNFLNWQTWSLSTLPWCTMDNTAWFSKYKCIKKWKQHYLQAPSDYIKDMRRTGCNPSKICFHYINCAGIVWSNNIRYHAIRAVLHQIGKSEKEQVKALG